MDDLIISSNSPHDSIEQQVALSAEFQMKHVGQPARLLGVQTEHMEVSFLIHQSDLIHRILQRFGVADIFPAITPTEPKVKFDKSMSGSPSFHSEY